MTTLIREFLDFIRRHVTFRGELPIWLMIIFIILSSVFVFWLYARESMKMSLARRNTLAALRCLTIACIIFLLGKPVIVSEGKSTKSLPIAVLIDNTQSMNHRDPRTTEEDRIRASIAANVFAPDYGLTLNPNDYDKLTSDLPTRAEVAMNVFQNPRLNLLEGLRKKGPLQEYLFGSQLHGAGKDWQKSVTATEAQTAILGSINELLQRDDNELPAAIVLATDGRDNNSKISWDEIGRECARLKIPIFIYGVGGGSTSILQLKGDPVRDTLVVEDMARVNFRWSSQGIKSGQFELNVTLGDRIVATKRIPVKEGDDLTETLTFVPEKRDVRSEKQPLVASIRIVGGKEESKITKPVAVVEGRVKVLYVENSPRWEFKFLMRTLLRDRVVDPSFVLINGDEKTMKAGPPFLPGFPKDRKDLFAFNMLIIGDVDAGYFSAEQRKWIVDFVEDGRGLVMIAGREHAPASYFEKEIGKILPVEFDVKKFAVDDKARLPEYRPLLSDDGKRDLMLTLGNTFEENQNIWAALPGWYWHYPVTKLRPGAISLLDHPKETIDDYSPQDKEKKKKLNMPLIARRYAGTGTVIFFATDETWRWRFNEGDKHFARFWGQVVYQVGLQNLLGNKSQIIPDGDFYKGQSTKVYARLSTADHTPLERKRIPASLDRADGKLADDRSETVFFEPVDGQPGLYMTTITKNKTGDYNLRLPASLADNAVLPIRVGLWPDDELAPGNLNEMPLRKLAEDTQGGYFREENLKDLVNAVNGKTVKVEPPPRHEVLLWTRWWALVTIVGLLTMEWLIRKFSNLS